MPASYRSPKTAIRPSPIDGRGLFARRAIGKGEIVAIKGGHILDRRALARVEGRIAQSFIQIADGFFIGAATAAEVKRNKLYINHSCAPNVGILGQIIFVAMRDVRAGEELTYDWAMEENIPARTACRCGAPTCRKILTGRDWTRPALRRRYRRYLSAYLGEKTRRAATKMGKIGSARIQRKNHRIDVSKLERTRRILGTRSETETIHRAPDLVADEAALVKILHTFLLKGRGHIEDVDAPR